MTLSILAVLALYMVQVFVAASFKTVLAEDPAAATADHLRGKDQAPEPSVMGGRANRAVNNFKEALPVFLGVALLCTILGQVEGIAVTGAIVFFIARALYMPAYMVAIAGVRTAVWTVSWVGVGLMVSTLF